MSRWILTVVILAPLAGAVVVALMSARSHRQIRRGALLASFATLGFAIAALRMFHSAQVSGQPAWRSGAFVLSTRVAWLDLPPSVDLSYHVGVDGISIWLVMLTAVLTPLAIWASFRQIQERVREFYALMLLLETGLLGVFCARDLLLFYVFFEFTLVPLFFVIGIWGGPQRRLAAGRFFIFTLTGSLLTLAGVLYLAYQAWRSPAGGAFTFDLETLYAVGRRLDTGVQWWVFLAIAAGFAVKVPLLPLHTWLPLAHTEAPTAGSVLLAGVLLKLGTYGFLRFGVPMLPAAAMALAPVLAALAIIGIIYGALVAWVQTDVKKLVAYSSVSHLGFVILGMFSLKMAGLTGSVLQMINHGLSTGALFLVVGMIYERYHTRRIDELGGLARRMPWLAFFLVFFALSSLGLPGLNGFVGEILVLLGTFSSQTGHDGLPPGPLGPPYAALAATGIILSAVYLLWMCQCILFGPLREPRGTPDTSNGRPPDLEGREVGILAPIAALCLLIGLWPGALTRSIQPALATQVLARFHTPGGEPDGAAAQRSSEARSGAWCRDREGRGETEDPCGPGAADRPDTHPPDLAAKAGRPLQFGSWNSEAVHGRREWTTCSY